MSIPHNTEEPTPADHGEEGPPIFATWSRLYTAVLVYLILLIVLFFVFQASFT